MPKDKTKNINNYKIRGGVINEYEYHQNQEALTHDQSKGDDEISVDQPQKGTKSTKKKPASKAAKTTKKSSSNALQGASAKKLAARKAARK